MAITNILKKLFGTDREKLIENYDDWGQPIQKQETINERRLRKHLEREHKKKISELLQKYDEKHKAETSPYNAHRIYYNKYRRR